MMIYSAPSFFAVRGPPVFPFWLIQIQPTVTYTNSTQGENIPQGLCYIWAQTLRQGNYLVPAQITPKKKISIFTPIYGEGCIYCI
jgi:hypothetical protein